MNKALNDGTATSQQWALPQGTHTQSHAASSHAEVVFPMKQSVLSMDEVLAGYDAVSQLYPHLPPLSAWRAWECAAYRRYSLPEPVLDVGCGDGRFFQLVWPKVREVVGVEIDPAVAEAAVRSGVYRTVHISAAHELPVSTGAFAAAFANCSLEHMDRLSEVLREICRALRPGGLFLGSVVTDKFPAWTTLPLLVEKLGQPAIAERLQTGYLGYHHLVNALTPRQWVERLEEAGFEVLEQVSIAPEMFSRLFLLLDHLWHVPRPQGELGNELQRFIMSLPNFTLAFRQIVTASLQVEKDWATGSGAVFCARRKP
jgi:SAM-dependent methyltransferase